MGEPRPSRRGGRLGAARPGTDGAGAPVSLHHEAHAHPLDVGLVCLACGEPVTSDDVDFRIGPGYPADVGPARDIRSRLGPPIAAQVRSTEAK